MDSNNNNNIKPKRYKMLKMTGIEKYIREDGSEGKKEHYELNGRDREFDFDRHIDRVCEKILHKVPEYQRQYLKKYLDKTLPKPPQKPVERLVFSIILYRAYIDGKANWVKDSGKVMFTKRTRVLFHVSESTAHHIYQTIRSNYIANYHKEEKLIDIPFLYLKENEYYKRAYNRAMQIIGNYFADYELVR